MKDFFKMLVYGADGQPSLTSTLALTAFVLFIFVTLYLVLSGQNWDSYSVFASVTCGGGLLAQVTGKGINNFGGRRY